MVRPTLRLEEKAKQDVAMSIVGILEELAKASSTKKDLLVAARVIKLARSMAVEEAFIGGYVRVVEGENKHSVNFLNELEQLS